MNNRRGFRGNFVVCALIALMPASFGIAAGTDAVLAAARPSQAALDTCFSGQGGEPRIVACSIVIGSSHSDIELEKALNHRGLDYQAQGEHEKAVEDFTQLIKMAPAVAAYRDSRQASYRALGNLAAALVDANSAVILADDSAYVYHSRATVLFAMKQYSDALQDYDRAIKLDPQPAFRYLDKATDLRRLSRNGDAIATLTQGLALNPNDKVLLKARAQTELASDLVVAAQQDFITLVALDPTDTLAVSTLADLRRTIGAANIASYAAASTGAPPIVVKLKRLGGIFTVPVEINSQLTLDFTVDSGASDVTIPADVLSTLTRTGTVEGADFTGKKTYQTADGRAVDAPTLKLRALKLGNETFRNIDASVTPVEGDLLLGQTFLSQFQSWSINNDQQALILVPRPDAGAGQ